MTPSKPMHHIHIRGLVQGVGFRPLVYRMAVAQGRCGQVSNGKDGVHIDISGSDAEAQDFLDRLQRELPTYARITGADIRPSTRPAPPDFRITEDHSPADADLILTPDRAICPECRREIGDPADRRYGYPFTTCLHCGPRFGVITALPYDRERTTLASWTPCPVCLNEYTDPQSRRHHAQSHTCPDCAIPLYLEEEGTRWTGPGDALARAAALLADGKILAVKGLGGYLLMTDARDATAVRRLRERKHRPDKPLAVLYPGLDDLEADTFLDDPAREILTGHISPIVLLETRSHPASGLALDELAPGLDRIGAMLPPTGLLALLTRSFPHPLVATSGNLSGSPIFFRDKDAQTGLKDIADAFLYHPREIVLPQDDSVVRFPTPGTPPVILRRSRGLAPAIALPGLERGTVPYLALGAHMKGALAIRHNGRVHVSQYLGNLESYEAQGTYRQVARHLLEVLDARPLAILTDRHPGYFTSTLGTEWGEAWDLPVHRLPHHLSHFAAVLAEHDRLEPDDPVLGVIWDGTGLGDDDRIWGGEMFVFDRKGYQRVAHLTEFPWLAGDTMAREPRLSALALSMTSRGASSRIRNHFADHEWTTYRTLANAPNALLTSSMGRLFDGVAALSGLHYRQSYEGQSAMALEALAGRECGNERPALPLRNHLDLDHALLMDQLTAMLDAGGTPGQMARAFHLLLIDWIRHVGTELGIRSLAFSGGVWQNGLLNHLAREKLGRDFDILSHRQLSPNDENIPVGQLALAGQAARGLYLPNREGDPPLSNS